MRNIQSRHKRIKHINSFILRVPVLGSRVPYMGKGIDSHPYGPGSRVSDPNFRLPRLT